MNVEDFGAVGDGVTDNTAAIQDALDSLPRALNGSGPRSGALEFGPGVFKFSNDFPSLANTSGISIIGLGAPGPCDSRPATWPTTTLLFAGGDLPRLIDARSSSGFTMDGVGILFDNSDFAGKAIDLSHSSIPSDSVAALIRRCSISGVLTGEMNSKCLISLENAICSKIEQCFFSYSQAGVRGGEGDYSNAIQVSTSTFICTFIGIANPGQAWTIENNTFEGLQSGAPDYMHHAVAWDDDTAYIGAQAVTIRGNWMGDAFGDQVWIELAGQGPFCIENNYINGGVGGIRFGTAGSGNKYPTAVSIRNNLLSNLSEFAVDCGAELTNNWDGLEIVGNDLSGTLGTGNPILNIPTDISFPHITGVAIHSNAVQTTQTLVQPYFWPPVANKLLLSRQIYGTSYVLGPLDAGKIVESLNSAVTYCEIPADTFPTDTVIDLYQEGTGQLRIQAGTGVILRSENNHTNISQQFGVAKLRQRGINYWVLSGDLA